MVIELNREVVDKLKAIAFLMATERKVPCTAYFPFLVCFKWVYVGYNGEQVDVGNGLNAKREKVCEKYNLYLQSDGTTTFEELRVALDNLLYRVEQVGIRAKNDGALSSYLINEVKK